MPKTQPSGRNVGVILCDCRGILDPVLDFGRIETELGALAAVGTVKVCPRLCEGDACAKIAQVLLKDGVDRLVVAACDEETVAGAVDGTLGDAGLNSGLWWSVNIRGSGGKPTPRKEPGTSRAIERLTAAVSRVCHAEPVKSLKTKASRDVAVIGGGIAGMQSALSMANLGHNVFLVCRGKELGGAAAALPELFGHIGQDAREAETEVRKTVTGLIRDLSSHPAVRLSLGTTVKSVTGELGNFTVTLASPTEEQSLHAGAVVLATGAGDRPAGSDQPGDMVDLAELVRAVRSGNPPRRVGIVVDAVGEQGRAVSAEVFSIAERLAETPDTRVTVFCRHARVAATGMEVLYRRARSAGVSVVKCSTPVSVSLSGSKRRIVYIDPILGRSVVEDFDTVALADRQARQVHPTLVSGLRNGPKGELQYDSVWLLPVQTNRPGVFVVGEARGNSDYREALTDGMAAATQIHELLGDGWIRMHDDAAVVDTDKCILCLTCRRICPHGAVEIDDESKAARVSVASCQRCGMCAAECPARAIALPRFTDAQVAADVGERPGVTVFACENSALPAASAAMGAGEADVQIVRVPCAGKIDPRTVLAALEKGASKVLVLGCHPENCRYLSGSSRAEKRMARLSAMLEKAGVDRTRVAFKGIAAVEPARFAEFVMGRPSAQ